MSITPLRHTGFLVLLAASITCSDSSGPSALPAAIVVWSGDGQAGAVGTQLPDPLVVRVVDSTSAPVVGVSVTWIVQSGGGTITPSSSTDTAGYASAAWTMGTTGGPAVATAAVSGLSPVSFGADALVLLDSVVSVSAGMQHTCASTISRSVYCWGHNDVGQLGRPSSSPLEPCQFGKCATRALPVLGQLVWDTAVVGGDHTCGLVSGTAYCWGGNQFGELGVGSTGGGDFPPSIVLGGLQFAALSAGGLYTCGLTSVGAAFCWGSNYAGALGIGVSSDTNAPTPVAGGVTFSMIATDKYPNTDPLTCAIAVDSAAYCWGGNRLGELGDSSYGGSQATPQRVAGGFKFTSITVGEAHACALTAPGSAYCWGSGDLLGNGGLVEYCGQTPCSTYPVQVAYVPSLTHLAAGLTHTCGVTAAGEAYCWGYGDVGQLGNVGINYSGLPILIVGGLHFSSLSSGRLHTCGVTTTGAAYCWGGNERGQLGDGSFLNKGTPVRVIRF